LSSILNALKKIDNPYAPASTKGEEKPFMIQQEGAGMIGALKLKELTQDLIKATDKEDFNLVKSLFNEAKSEFVRLKTLLSGGG